MTDVYIAYAREDRESVRTLSEMLRFEGWDVWMDPSEPDVYKRQGRPPWSCFTRLP